jgi:endonuclease/exonuclease/phosphatase family metal-dependent hydrolase
MNLTLFFLFFFQMTVINCQDFPLKVMTLNIRLDTRADSVNWWENRRKLVTLSIRNADPDLLGMQEVLERQLIYLRDNLPGYSYAGVGRDDGKTAGEYSPVFYKNDRFEMIANGTFWLSPTPNDTGSVGWDAALTRICSWVRLKDKRTGEEFCFLNTHFDHMGVTARAESAKLISDFINTSTDGLPAILTGDFNSNPLEGPYQVLVTPGTGLKDACMAANPPGGFNEETFNGFGHAEQAGRIDFIFFKGKWTVGSYEVPKIKFGDLYISDHWPVLAKLSAVGGRRSAVGGDTTIVQAFTFDSIVTRRAEFQFPDNSKRYEKILMYYTLKCDSLTPHDKYPCGEWDYTTYTRVYSHTGKMDSVKYSQPDFVVKGKSPRSYLYSKTPTCTYFDSYSEEGKRGRGERETGRNGESDRFARFEGADYIEVPGDAFSDVKNEITVSFWLNGDPMHQPMASTIFEGLDKDGKRVINLHVPYDNGVVYWDAGGHGEGLTDNIYKAASPQDYKGRWTHWVVTKNAETGEQKIYLNGVLFQKGTGLKRTMDGITTFRIGSNGNGDGKFYQGSADDFAIWNRELDSLEIQSLENHVPQDYPSKNLVFAFDFNDLSSFPVIRSINIPTGKPVGYNGKCFGNPSFIAYKDLPYANDKPSADQHSVKDSIANPVVSIVLYGDSLRPNIPTDTLIAWPGYSYYCNSQGIVIDSTAVPQAEGLDRKTRYWYGEPFEVIEPFEIARFITPYGKRLDLGLHGFTWIYDVTDYEPLLHGKVDLQAANGQELIDLKFVFIEGVPPRDVISVKNIWPEGSYKYKDLVDNVKLPTANCQLSNDANSFMLRARISGHGEYGPQACCEWAPKTHSFIVNDNKRFDWKIWRDCGMNPVYPQGGTWQFDRAGWCPGTFVDTYDFEITPYVNPGDPVTIDYSLEPYDPDNGEESGNFEMAMQLFEYSAPNYHLNLELNDILAPSTRQEFRRMNPVSLNPVIRVKNTGSDSVFSFTVNYGLDNGEKEEYEWKGKLGFMQAADVVVPKPSWKGLTLNSVFEASITAVNGKPDEIGSDNHLVSDMAEPVILPSEFIIHVKTQGLGYAADNAYKIIDEKGNVVAERPVFEDDSTYEDLIKLAPGAYDFTFTDKNEDGMIRHWWMYWEDKTKVGENGELKILDVNKNEIMNLGYDFAEKRTLQFFVGEPE